MTSATGKVKGFTFIELLFVIAIIGILIGISLPGFRNTFNNLQLNSASSELQSFMNYLSERSIVEGKIIYFDIDTGKKEFRARIKDSQATLRTYSLPEEIGIEAGQKQALFYPDGRIDNITIKLSHLNNKSIILTTKGVYGRVKLQEE